MTQVLSYSSSLTGERFSSAFLAAQEAAGRMLGGVLAELSGLGAWVFALADREKRGVRVDPVPAKAQKGKKNVKEVDQKAAEPAPPEEDECEDDEDLEAESEEEEIDEAALAAGLAGEDSDSEGESDAVPVRRPKSEWSTGPGEDDPELIRRFLTGDQEAFNRLVIKYQHKIYNLCYRIISDRDEAQDMAQEIFLTVHKSLKDFRGESMFSTWIFRVTVNHCKNRIKYLGRRRYYSSVSLDQPQEVEDGELYHEVEDETPDAEARLSSEEIQALVQDAIASLDADHRIVILLRDIQDLSYEEIAEIVGIKVGTVKSRIHRARNDLKKKLENKIKL